jgi:hypothetical protein
MVDIMIYGYVGFAGLVFAATILDSVKDWFNK